MAELFWLTLALIVIGFSLSIGFFTEFVWLALFSVALVVAMLGAWLIRRGRAMRRWLDDWADHAWPTVL